MRVIVSGINGVMGKHVKEILESKNITVIGYDKTPSKDVYNHLDDIDNIDGIIDFSHKDALKPLLEYASKNHIPITLATTGYTKEDLDLITKYSQTLPIFYSSNYSVGIYVINKILKEYVKYFSDYDIEIIDIHHNRKKDAPSGTALMMAESINEGLKENRLITNGHETKRDKNEITIHAIRGGNIVGDHEALLLGEEETIKIVHQAHTRKVFAQGAIKALEFLLKQENGLYQMEDLIKEGI